MKKKVTAEFEIDLNLDKETTELVKGLQKQIKSLERKVEYRDSKISDLENTLSLTKGRFRKAEELLDKMREFATEFFDLIPEEYRNYRY